MVLNKITYHKSWKNQINHGKKFEDYLGYFLMNKNSFYNNQSPLTLQNNLNFLKKYQMANILYESARHQGKCIPCQSDWFQFYAYKSDIVLEFQIKKRQQDREMWRKYLG